MPKSHKPKSDVSICWFFFLVSFLLAHQFTIIACDLLIPSVYRSHLWGEFLINTPPPPPVFGSWPITAILQVCLLVKIQLVMWSPISWFLRYMWIVMGENHRYVWFHMNLWWLSLNWKSHVLKITPRDHTALHYNSTTLQHYATTPLNYSTTTLLHYNTTTQHHSTTPQHH